MAWFDALMLLLLVVVMPARAMLNSFGKRKTAAAAESRLTRYCRSIAIALTLAGALVFIWLVNARSFEALGFDVPISLVGMIGLAIACVVLGVLAAVSLNAPKRTDPGKPDMPVRMMPRNARERVAFVIFGLVLGIAWEMLYRGYLLWLLTPWAGIAFAVPVAAISYGLAHGYQDKKQIISSLVAAFAFTIAFALTHSLWWLILIHCALPLIGLLSMAHITEENPQSV